MKNILLNILIVITVGVSAYFVKADIVNMYLKLFNNSKISEEFISQIRTDSDKYILAHSTFFDKVSLIYSDIILDVGTQDGVMVDALVYTLSGRPVGVIKSADIKSSKLELFTSYKRLVEATLNSMGNVNYNGTPLQSTSTELIDNSSSSIMVTEDLSSSDEVISQRGESVEDSGKIEGYNLDIIGDGAYGFTVRVLDSFDIDLDDIIYLRNYPELPVGVVADVIDIQNENEKTIYIKSNFDRSNNKVFIIKK